MKKRWIALLMMLTLALVLTVSTVLAESAGEGQGTAVPIEKVWLAPAMKDVPAMKKGIKIGEPYDLAVWVRLEPKEASKEQLVYVSSDESIAVVEDGGNVVGKAPGKVTVTIMDPVSKKSDKVQLTIIRPVSSIRLSPDTDVVVFTGQKLKIKADVLPEDASNKKVEWFSNDENIAKVKNGTVTGVNPGSTMIHCQAQDGSYTDSCIILTVMRPLKKITFASKSTTVQENEYVYLTFNTEPVDATNRDLEWFSSDENVATVEVMGHVHGKKPGKATITAVAKDGSGVKASTTVYVEPKDPFEIDYLWWETDRYGNKTGRIKYDIVNKCVNRKITNMGLEVNCYDVNGSVMGTTYTGMVASAQPGKRFTTRWLFDYMNGLNNATQKLEIKVMSVTFSDGLMIYYPYGTEPEFSFNLR